MARRRKRNRNRSKKKAPQPEAAAPVSEEPAVEDSDAEASDDDNEAVAAANSAGSASAESQEAAAAHASGEAGDDDAASEPGEDGNGEEPAEAVSSRNSGDGSSPSADRSCAGDGGGASGEAQSEVSDGLVGADEGGSGEPESANVASAGVSGSDEGAVDVPNAGTDDHRRSEERSEAEVPAEERKQKRKRKKVKAAKGKAKGNKAKGKAKAKAASSGAVDGDAPATSRSKDKRRKGKSKSKAKSKAKAGKAKGPSSSSRTKDKKKGKRVADRGGAESMLDGSALERIFDDPDVKASGLSRWQLKPVAFGPYTWDLTEDASTPQSLAKLCPDGNITVVTYNVCRHKIGGDVRFAYLCDILEATKAHVIALQEVTPAFFEYLRSQQWATAYYMSAADRQAVALSGLLTLSRIPFAKVYLEEIPSGAKRTAVIARLDLCGASLTVANVQMDSPTKPQLPVAQLAWLADRLSGRSEVVIAGDLQCYSQNADAAWETRLPLEEHGWVDGWDLDSGERSATFDAGHNAMAQTLTQAAPETALRLDRILVRSDSGGWVPSDCRLLGLTKIPEYRNLWPSHHFGVEVVLKGSVIDTEANGGCVIS